MIVIKMVNLTEIEVKTVRMVMKIMKEVVMKIMGRGVCKN